MPVTIKALGDGVLPTTVGVLYTCPGSTQALARVTVFSAVDGEDVQILINRTGSLRNVISTLLNENEQITSIVITLEAGDTIEGVTANAASATYIINGFEVS